MYTVQDGKLKGTLFKLHYTDYNNEQGRQGQLVLPEHVQLRA